MNLSVSYIELLIIVIVQIVVIVKTCTVLWKRVKTIDEKVSKIENRLSKLRSDFEKQKDDSQTLDLDQDLRIIEIKMKQDSDESIILVRIDSIKEEIGRMSFVLEKILAKLG